MAVVWDFEHIEHPKISMECAVRSCRKKKPIRIYGRMGIFFGAEDEIRTRDPHLGKVMLYQLSYFRVWALVGLQI